MRIYETLEQLRIETFAKVPDEYRPLFENLDGGEGFWGGDIVHMLVGSAFADWRREGLQKFPGGTPWERSVTSPAEAGVYIEAWPFKVTTYFERVRVCPSPVAVSERLAL